MKIIGKMKRCECYAAPCASSPIKEGNTISAEEQDCVDKTKKINSQTDQELKNFDKFIIELTQAIKKYGKKFLDESSAEE